jgi:hypothetical protein
MEKVKNRFSGNEKINLSKRNKSKVSKHLPQERQKSAAWQRDKKGSAFCSAFCLFLLESNKYEDQPENTKPPLSPILILHRY